MTSLLEPITYEDIQNVMPFGNTADIANISGKVLWQALEYGVSDVENNNGRFLQVSGKFISNTSEPLTLCQKNFCKAI